MFKTIFCLLAAILGSVTLLTTEPAQANCGTAPAGVVLRVWEAPAWCQPCKIERAFMESQRWTEYIPMSLNKGQVIQVQLQFCDIDDKIENAYANQAGIKDLPVSDVLVDGRLTARKTGMMLGVNEFQKLLRKGVPGGSHGRLPEQLSGDVSVH